MPAPAYAPVQTGIDVLRSSGFAALKGMQMSTPFGQVQWRAIDNQSTMGAYVGQLARKGDKGVMVNWRYADGGKFQPSDEEVRKLRKE